VNYSALAPLYDRLMAHVKYELWLALIKKIHARYFPGNKPSILEIGGGTGTLGSLLLKNGYECLCSDISPGMCYEAAKKGLPVFCADAKSLPVKRNFTLVIFLYDGINYLRSLHEYTHLFHEIYSVLDKNGCFLFDITTETNSKNNFLDFFETEDFGDSSYIRHSYYNKKQKSQHNDFTVYLQHEKHPSCYTKHYENHIQNIFSVNEILQALPDNYFKVLGVWDNYSFNKYTHRSERIHFLLQKNDKK